MIHTHSHYVSVFSTTRRTIGMYNVVSVLFHDDQALYEDDATHPVVGSRPHGGGARSAPGADHEEPWRSRRVAVARARDHRGVHARGRRPGYHIEAEAIGGTEFPEAEVVRGREKYHKYFLPQMWEANLRRLRRSDPDLWEWLDREA